MRYPTVGQVYKDAGCYWRVEQVSKQKERAILIDCTKDGVIVSSLPDPPSTMQDMSFAEIAMMELIKTGGTSAITLGEITEARCNAENAISELIRELEAKGVFVDEIKLERYQVVGSKPGLSSIRLALRVW